MKREELTELHYIAHLDNVRSILRLGILSNKRVSMIEHTSVAMHEIQRRRSGVNVPGGLKLHEYVNLYVCARNPMLYRLAERHSDLCVLQVSTGVLDLPGVVVTDGNAASAYVRFAAAPGGLSVVDRNLTFAENWTDNNQIGLWKKKSAKCAEVLVPGKVEPKFIMGAYVGYEQALDRLKGLGTGISINVNAHMFFRR